MFFECGKILINPSDNLNHGLRNPGSFLNLLRKTIFEYGESVFLFRQAHSQVRLPGGGRCERNRNGPTVSCHIMLIAFFFSHPKHVGVFLGTVLNCIEFTCSNALYSCLDKCSKYLSTIWNTEV